MFEQPIVGTDDNIGKVHLSKESELKWEMQSDAPMMSAKLVGYGDAQGTEQFLGIVQGGLEFAPARTGFGATPRCQPATICSSSTPTAGGCHV
jgi:hypothetical protein